MDKKSVDSSTFHSDVKNLDTFICCPRDIIYKNLNLTSEEIKGLTSIVDSSMSPPLFFFCNIFRQVSLSSRSVIKLMSG